MSLQLRFIFANLTEKIYPHKIIIYIYKMEKLYILFLFFFYFCSYFF